MFKAVLFDLDGTLLNIDMNFFLQKYFSRMQKMALEAGYNDSKGLVEQVFKSTGVMISDRNPEHSNEEIFMRDFFSNGRYPEKDFREFFERFYEREFPLLEPYCKPFAGVPEMMEKLFDKDLKVVVATNAVFPLTALQQRLNWAGVGHFDYDLITSYEIMHFCKPHKEYYQEVAEVIGVKPEECLMVGNDVGEDLPAGKIGMKTFLVEDMLIDQGVGLSPDWRGKLNDLFSFMEKI